jgi:hypothetical protein
LYIAHDHDLFNAIPHDGFLNKAQEQGNCVKSIHENQLTKTGNLLQPIRPLLLHTEEHIIQRRARPLWVAHQLAEQGVRGYVHQGDGKKKQHDRPVRLPDARV